MGFEIDKRELAKLNQNLAKIHKKFGDAGVEPILVKAAEIVSSKLKQNIKEGPTGNLKSAVITRKLARKPSFPPTVISGIDRAIAPHAHLVEFGTRERFHKSGKSVGAANGYPFFRFTWDSTKGQVSALIESEFKRLLEGAVD